MIQPGEIEINYRGICQSKEYYPDYPNKINSFHCPGD